MIYPIVIDVKKPTTWGHVFARELSLPARIKRIKAITAYALCADNNQDLYGILSLALNNTDVVINTAIHNINKLENKGIRRNTVNMDTLVSVPFGSRLRATMEEVLYSPLSTLQGYTIKLLIHYD